MPLADEYKECMAIEMLLKESFVTEQKGDSSLFF